jgi:hypothetical protein
MNTYLGASLGLAAKDLDRGLVRDEDRLADSARRSPSFVFFNQAALWKDGRYPILNGGKASLTDPA